MSDKAFKSAWDAIEDTPAQAENMRLRSSLMMAISEHIRVADLNQTQAAKLFAVTQPRISDLMRGKINLFSIDTLIAMLSAAGIGIEMRLRRTGVKAERGESAVKVRRVDRPKTSSKPARHKAAA
jgi:predicted XRE-type DNA-binding protein